MSISRSTCIPLLVALLLVGVLLAGCAALPIQPPTGTVPESAATSTEEPSEEPAATEAAAEETSAAAPAVAGAPGTEEEYNGMTVGFTAEGYPYRGSLSAPVVVNEFSDFECPFCARYFVQTEPSINEAYVKPGTLLVIFRDLPLAELHPNAPAAHEAAQCAGEQGAALFWAMHDQLFRTQTVWSNLGDPSSELANLAEVIGADMTAYNNCVAGDEMAALVQARLNEGLALGFNGTPSFLFTSAGAPEGFPLVGAQPFGVFAETIDAIAAGEVPPSAQQQQQQQGDSAGIPAWASPEGKAVDPNNPGFTMYGDQTRGSADAPLVIVEFSDFQCPYCLQYHEATEPTLLEQYVDTGLVRFVYKHFPLSIHPQAPAAGIAAECASDQGMFWEMNDMLFGNVDAWSISDPAQVLTDMAGELGLDTDAFAACLQDPDMAARVSADLADGSQFVQGTPTFIMLWGNGGQIIPGALPLETFTQEIDRILAEIGG